MSSYTRSFWLFKGWAMVNSFSSLKKMKFTSLCIGLIVFWNMLNFIGFSVIHVSQGSVATYVRCGGMSTPHYIANFLLSLAVKECLKSVNIWQSYCQNLGASFFWNTVYIFTTFRLYLAFSIMWPFRLCCHEHGNVLLSRWSLINASYARSTIGWLNNSYCVNLHQNSRKKLVQFLVQFLYRFPACVRCIRMILYGCHLSIMPSVDDIYKRNWPGKCVI